MQLVAGDQLSGFQHAAGATILTITDCIVIENLTDDFIALYSSVLLKF